MQTVDVQALRDDTQGVIAAAQSGDVLVTDHGKVVAVVSKPRTPTDWESYWRQREALLAEVIAKPGWDSTTAVSEDRDRS